MLIKPDLDCSRHIADFVDLFYSQLVVDKQLAAFFTDVATVDFSTHIPIICQYWEKLLLGEREYSRHTMNIHRAVDGKRKFQSADFALWSVTFVTVLDDNFEGHYTHKAKTIAMQIASNMEKALQL